MSYNEASAALSPGMTLGARATVEPMGRLEELTHIARDNSEKLADLTNRLYALVHRLGVSAPNVTHKPELARDEPSASLDVHRMVLGIQQEAISAMHCAVEALEQL